MNERILKVIDYLDISISEFERSCNLSNGAVSKMGDNTRRSTLNKICDTYPQLNIDWLLTGKGDMVKEYTVDSLRDRILEYCDFKKMTINEFQAKAGLDKYLFDDSSKAINSHIIKKILYYHPDLNRDWLLTGEGDMLKSGDEATDKPRINYSQGVPYYNVDFIGGFDIVENDQTVNPEYLIDFKPYAKATCWCNISGHSMEPEINNGDIIALRRIDDFSFLPMGEIYAIVTKNDMRTVKRIGPSANPDNYTLIPTNKSPEYGIQELPKNMILAVFEVMGCMKRF